MEYRVVKLCKVCDSQLPVGSTFVEGDLPPDVIRSLLKSESIEVIPPVLAQPVSPVPEPKE